MSRFQFAHRDWDIKIICQQKKGRCFAALLIDQAAEDIPEAFVIDSFH
jgi:hypothetical protein